MDMQQIRFGKPGSVNPFEGWGLPLGVSYPRHASRRPGRSTEIHTALCVSKDFLQLWSNNNRLIISCVFMWLTSHDIFSFQIIFLSAHRSLDYNKDRSIDRG